MQLLGYFLFFFWTLVLRKSVTQEVMEGTTSGSFNLLAPGVYEILNQTIPGAFTINILGQVTLTGHVTMDYEETPFHKIFYRSINKGAPPGISTLTITILDTNDNAPVFVEDIFYGAVTSKNIAGSTVVSVKATDADGVSPNNNITSYDFESGNTNDAFEITRDGEVKVKSGMETIVKQQKLYRLIVIATDGGTPTLTGTASVIIQACGK